VSKSLRINFFLAALFLLPSALKAEGTIDFANPLASFIPERREPTFELVKTGETRAGVNYRVVAGSGGEPFVCDNAEKFDDYNAHGGAVLWAAGDARTTLTIPVINDTLSERRECFHIELFDADGATLLHTSKTFVIMDDDNRCAKHFNLPSPDVNSDGNVDLTDFALVKRDFGKKGYYFDADANCDGQVDLTDFGMVKAAFGTVVP
jgi:hypothetical protein